MLEKYKVKTCLESNPKFWHSFLVWYNQWNGAKLNPTEWTEIECNDFLNEWHHIVLDRYNIDYKENL
jgi:hypothetical protein